MVIYHGFNLSEGVGLGPLLQSGQIQGRQQLTSPKVAEPGYFCGKSETYAVLSFVDGYSMHYSRSLSSKLDFFKKNLVSDLNRLSHCSQSHTKALQSDHLDETRQEVNRLDDPLL